MGAALLRAVDELTTSLAMASLIFNVPNDATIRGSLEVRNGALAFDKMICDKIIHGARTLRPPSGQPKDPSG